MELKNCRIKFRNWVYMYIICVGLGCPNRTPQTQWLNQHMSISHNSEAGSPRLGSQQDQGLVRSIAFSPWTHRSLLLHSHSPKGLGLKAYHLIQPYLPSTDPISRYRHVGIRTFAFGCEGHNSVHSCLIWKCKSSSFPQGLVSWPRTTSILSHPGPQPSVIVSVSSSKLKERQLGGSGQLPAGVLTRLGRGWGQPRNCWVLAHLAILLRLSDFCFLLFKKKCV